jgi:hypothetical protein
MEKLDLLPQFKKLYGSKINPALLEVCYCQSAHKAYLELTFKGYPTPLLKDLKFIGGEIIQNEDGEDMDIVPLCNPDADIIDNARALLALDGYSLINCIDEIFTAEAANAIAEAYNQQLKNQAK